MENSTPQENTAPEEKSFFGIIIHSFFIIPFLITVFALLLFAGVRILTHEQHTVYDYLNDVKAGSLNKRWQAAFELSKILANPKQIPRDDRFVAELTTAFEQSRHDDSRVRQYLALAMGRTGNEKFLNPLLSSLKENNPENLSAFIYALGMLGEKESATAIYPYLNNPEPKIRLTAVMALGNIGNREAIPFIKKALYDTEPNVQWDAAIALAKMGDAAGREILLKLLDRNYLTDFKEVDTQEQTHIVLVTMEAAANLNDQKLNEAIAQLGQSDQNMNVRKKALIQKNTLR